MVGKNMRGAGRILGFGVGFEINFKGICMNGQLCFDLASIFIFRGVVFEWNAWWGAPHPTGCFAKT